VPVLPKTLSEQAPKMRWEKLETDIVHVRFPVVSRDFDKPVVILVSGAGSVFGRTWERVCGLRSAVLQVSVAGDQDGRQNTKDI
jgi:hypothetical protein